PCRQLTPLLEREAAKHEGKLELAKVDTDANQSLSQAFGVQGIPAVKAFRDGRIVNEFVGAQPPPVVERFFAGLVPSEAEELAAAAGRGDVPEPVERVRITAGHGIEGDYHAGVEGNVALTLIAEEALDGLQRDTGLDVSHAETRRNVLTRGVDLNALVGKRFRVGDVEW